MKYKFSSYYKYCFAVTGEDGNVYYLDPELCNSDDIYRLEISSEGEMEEKEGQFFIDGAEFVKA